MSIRYQWIKFKKGFERLSEDYQPGVWILAEIDDDWPDGGISLFGVEGSYRQSDAVEWGSEVCHPESK